MMLEHCAWPGFQHMHGQGQQSELSTGVDVCTLLDMKVSTMDNLLGAAVVITYVPHTSRAVYLSHLCSAHSVVARHETLLNGSTYQVRLLMLMYTYRCIVKCKYLWWCYRGEHRYEQTSKGATESAGWIWAAPDGPGINRAKIQDDPRRSKMIQTRSKLIQDRSKQDPNKIQR